MRQKVETACVNAPLWKSRLKPVTWTYDGGSCFAGNADRRDFEVPHCQMDRARRNCFQIGETELVNRDVGDQCPEKYRSQ